MAPKKSPSASTNPSPSDDDSCIRLECDRALNALLRGNHTKAIKLVKESLSRHSISNHNPAMLHRTLGHIHFMTACRIADSHTKYKHLKDAAESAKQALVFSQNSISNASFYAEVLFELSTLDHDKKDYQEVIQECERALMIEDPVDPFKESLFSDRLSDQFKGGTQEWRVVFMKQKLRELIEKCKNVGDGNRKEESNGDGNRKEEIKEVVELKSGPQRDTHKEIKALHERRREVEARVMAARPSQQRKLATFQCPSQDDTVEERRSRKYVNPKKIVPNVDRMVQVKSYWKETMSVEKKRGFLKVGTKDLEAHFSKTKLAKGVLKEAIDFAMEENKWKFWVCCCCGERFRDSELNMEHLKIEHMGNLSEMLQAYVPEVAGDECIDMVENGVWKPVDTLALVKIIENQSRFESGDVVNCDSADKDLDDSKDCHSIDKENDPEVFLTDIDEKQKWPLCDDSKRTEMLEKIHAVLQSFLRNKCLAVSYVKEIMEYAIKALMTRIPESQIDNHGLKETLLVLCFLEAPQLEVILALLEDLASSCGLSYLSGDCTSDDKLKDARQFCIKERIVFSSDLSCLCLDERFLRGELIPTTYQDAIADDGTAVTSAVDVHESDDLPDSDAFINWLLTGAAIEEKLEAWASLREASKNQGMEVFQILEKEFKCLRIMLTTKHGHILYRKVPAKFVSMCHEEDKKREQIAQYDQQSYASLLSKLQKELERKNDAATDTSELKTINRMYLKTISRILKEEQADSCIKTRILKLQTRLNLECHRLDAMILVVKAIMRQTELTLGIVSGFDYRSIMVHLLKSFTQAHLENLVDKDANEKSNAATEAFLVELGLDPKMNIDSECDDAGKIPGKSKLKKKKNDGKKAKHIKATSSSAEHLTFHHEKAEQVCSAVTHAEHYPNPEIGVPVNTDELKQQEEELNLKTEIQVAQRKLVKLWNIRKNLRTRLN